MKGAFVAAAAAALVGSAAASGHHHNHRRAHELFEKRETTAEMCTTIYETIYGEMTWVPTPACSTTSTTTAYVNTTSTITTTAYANTTTALASTTTPATSTLPVSVPATTTSTTVVIPTTTTEICTVPTLVVETCATPGVYTFPATTVVVTETTTVCGASTTSVPAGTHTLGGVTTVVETETTVVCPYATTSTLPGGTVTSIIDVTTYVCPSAGTYTIAPITTVCVTETVVAVPVVTTFYPGTYTKPAVTTTIIETDVVVYCPFAIPETTTVVAVPATTSTTVVPVAATTTPAAVVTTTPAAAAKTTTSTTAAAKSTGTVNTSLGSSGDQWAITYTPYTTTGECKTAAQVMSDITEIKGKGFTTVRVYSTDCNTLPNVGAACESVGLKMIIGVFIGEVGCDNGNPDVASQIASIKAWAKWDLVELVIVGNEAGEDGYCTPAELKSLIVEVKEIITEAGCDVPVTTTDTVNTWQNSEFADVICPVVDVVACNAHAYFNAGTKPSEAGTFVKGQLDIVKSICGKEGYVTESGWPSVCVANGLATCSETDQATAISSLKEALGGSIVFFSYSDDAWKADGSCGCEQHWGCGQLF